MNVYTVVVLLHKVEGTALLVHPQASVYSHLCVRVSLLLYITEKKHVLFVYICILFVCMFLLLVLSTCLFLKGKVWWMDPKYSYVLTQMGSVQTSV